MSRYMKKFQSSGSIVQNGIYFQNDDDVLRKQRQKISIKEQFKNKRNTVMLPSNFARSDTLNLNIKDEFENKSKESITPSSACYEIKRVIGCSHIA